MKFISLLLSCILLNACGEKTNGLREEHAPEALPEITRTVNFGGFSKEKNAQFFPAQAYLQHNEVYNPDSVIPPQCYTKTEGQFNPCYVCHQSYSSSEKRPNVMNDGNLQGEYQFSELGETNHWQNLFVDRTPAIAMLTDEQIQDYVMQDNYTPWQQAFKKNTDWHGDKIDLTNLAYPKRAFEEGGMAKDGSYWVAYNYKPFPSTFWPTNGSSGDAMIRLPAVFRDLDTHFNQDVYLANLALVEMAIKDIQVITTFALSEVQVQRDLNGNGVLDEEVTQIQRQTHYVGDASATRVERMLYPGGTEFLHTIRYLGIDENGSVVNAPRMKEVRYMKKHLFKSRQNLASSYYIEAKDKNFEQYPKTIFLGDKGITNNFGWTINGFIEDKQGRLRQQHKQELAFCNGCHKTIGTTFDQTFSFARKVDGEAGWGYINLESLFDAPNIGNTKGEYLTYMQRVGGGDEFRQNQEMLAWWFTADREVDEHKVSTVDSLYDLITPSAKRAMQLNKAYYLIVQEQSFIFGRDAVIKPAVNVLEQVDASLAPLPEAKRFRWDLRLNWTAVPSHE